MHTKLCRAAGQQKACVSMRKMLMGHRL